MAMIQAHVRFDPDRAPEQRAFLAGRATVLRDSGGQSWVRLDEAAVATLVAQGMEVDPAPAADTLQLGPVAWRPGAEEPQPPAALRAAAPSGDGAAFWLVHWVTEADKAWLQDLALLGAEAIHTIDPRTTACQLSAAMADELRGWPMVRAVGLFHPAYVAALELTTAIEPLAASALYGLQLALPADAPEGNVVVELFDGIEPAEVQALLEAAGAVVVETTGDGFTLRVPAAAAAAVLSVPGLLSMSARTTPAVCNFNAGVIVGTNEVRSRGTVDFLVNLDGTGEIVGVVDSGYDVGVLPGLHADLARPVRVLRNVANAANPASDPAPYHGTHVAGTIAGDGSGFAAVPGTPAIVGMAPSAALVGQSPLPADPRPAFDFALAQGASLINNSWGHLPAPPANNRYDAVHATRIDRWCFLNPDTLVLFAAGNEERDFNGDGVIDGGRMRLQALAKNALTVGATENLRADGGWANSYVAFFGNTMLAVPGANGAAGAFSVSDNASDVALFSGRGVVRTAANVATGRIKPDIVAPGTNILSLRSSLAPPAGGFDANVPPGVPPALYALLLGTSMATPVVTGAAALLRQYFRSRHAQMRRPLLLEGVPLPAAAPLPIPQARPTMARHPDGMLCAWVSPALPGAPRRIVARRLGRALEAGQAVVLDAAPVELQTAVGDLAEPRLAVVGERCYLLHRHADGSMRLSCYDRALAPVAGFGAAGVVTLAPAARLDAAAPPALRAVGDHLACAWPVVAGQGGMFQRFRADTGAAVDAAPIALLAHDATGGHHPLTWTGSRYTFCGVRHGASFRLQLRQVTSAGQLVGADAVTVVDQAAELREPAIRWDTRRAVHVLVWCDARNHPGGEVFLQRLDAAGAPQGAATVVLTPPAGRRVRRPRITLHPDTGYLLAWEDDSQGGQFDLYLTTLDAAGAADGRLPPDPSAGGRRVLRVSDTPLEVSGHTVYSDSEGFVAAYQSSDEANSDVVGVHAVWLTRGLAFEAQALAATPLQRGGRYETAELLVHDSPALGALSAAWAGGSWDLLRLAPAPAFADELQWLRLNSDGLPDTTHGGGATPGVVGRVVPGLVLSLDLLWSGNDRRIGAVNEILTGISVYMDDADGNAVPGFGAGGVVALQDTVPVHDRTPPQLGLRPAPAFTVFVAYGSEQAGVLSLRLRRIDAAGAFVGNAVTLATASGTAAHQWFQFVPSENRALAIYHRVVGGATQVLCRRYFHLGTPDGPERRLSAVAGEARHGVLARRPTAVNSSRREYGAAWQYRADATVPYEIRFARLRRDGSPMANPPVAGVVLPVGDFAVVDPTTPGWAPGVDAVAPQLVCTCTHEPWATALPAGATAPEWSPSYGLAFLGDPGDGSRSLHFTVLDENGRRLALVQPPPAAGPLAARAPAPLLTLSSPGARVEDFKLVWNGRVFMLTWTELDAGRLHHKAVLVNRHAGLGAHDTPSAALLRATLVGGATNLTPGPLPDLAAGYGWGRLNLRQCLAPAQPVSFHVRDDCALGPGRRARYRFRLPPGTVLLRVTLNWTDPPGAALQNPMHLTVRAPAAGVGAARPEFRGNLWDAAAGRTHLSRPVALPPVPADSHENVQTFKQVVLDNPPAGEYEVEVTAAFGAHPFNQQNLQPFALVFVGSGPERAFVLPLAAVAGAAVY